MKFTLSNFQLINKHDFHNYKIYEMSKLEELVALKGHTDRVWSLEWSPCGKYEIKI